MVLNQKQRDHAIKLVSERIAVKKTATALPYMNPNEFAQKFIQDNALPLPSLGEMFPVDPNWQPSKNYQGGYYAPQFNSIKPGEIIPGLRQAWEDYCAQHEASNKDRCTELLALEETLIGEIMFGEDYSVIETAFKKIDSIK